MFKKVEGYRLGKEGKRKEDRNIRGILKTTGGINTEGIMKGDAECNDG